MGFIFTSELRIEVTNLWLLMKIIHIVNLEMKTLEAKLQQVFGAFTCFQLLTDVSETDESAETKTKQ